MSKIKSSSKNDRKKRKIKINKSNRIKLNLTRKINHFIKKKKH